MKERVFKNWKTSAIGILALVAGTVGMFMGKVTGTEFVGILTFAGTYLVAKDTLLEGVTGGLVKSEAK